ncbi:hypothetical protein QQP08_000216 [Theobroma cacao]|nr:hypothetical protein QQP08_000216 [Theobroma cacao]
MKKQVLFSSVSRFLFLCFLFLFICLCIKAQTCDPSGDIQGTTPPPGQCNQENNARCCVEGEFYTTYACSPPVSANTLATLTINSFQQGGDGGGPSKCDNQYHTDAEPVVALSTGWFSQGSRCNKFININGYGKTVRALVVDECDSQVGCDDQHAYQPPCRNNIVDASKAVWTALGVPESVQDCFLVEAYTCKPSGKIRGKKPPPKKCNKEHDSDCCVEGKLYDTYKCSPEVSNHTKGFLTLNGFDKGQDGGGPSECDKRYHKNSELVVALSTGWFHKQKRCLKFINIYGNGRSVQAKVVDECDSTMGCDDEHDYQPPCDNDIVDASDAVWEALGVSKGQRGGMDIYWSDA